MTHDRRALAAPLLLLQAGLALLAALGLLIYARASNALGSLAWSELAAVGGPLLLLLLAVGVRRGWRWASFGVVVWEVVTLLGTAFSLLASRGASLTLTFGLTGLALPAAVALLLARPRTSAGDLQRLVTAGLLLLTGFVHIALVPEHMRESQQLGTLLGLDGAAFVLLALTRTRFDSSWWRWSAIALLASTVLAYLCMLVSRREAVDDLGVATKLIELTALGLIVWPMRQRFDLRAMAATAGLVLGILVSGSVAWAASFRAEPTGHAHDARVAPSPAGPTDEQRAAAVRLVDETRRGIEQYEDVQVALRDGYRPSTPPLAPTVHYLNSAYQRDGRVLDPTRPEALVYANTQRGPVLLGAMYMLPRANTPVPDVAGSLAAWHTHTNLCFALPSFSVDGLESPFGTCPIGSVNAPTPAMLHVWTVPNPAGSFAEGIPSLI